MTFLKSNSTMFLKSSAGRANLDTKFPKPLAWLSVMMSPLGGGGGDKYTFTLGTYYISQPIFWENWAKTWSNSQSPTCLLYSHTVWCQSTPGELGRACLWTCEVLQQALSECYGRCSSHGLTHSCWLSPLWCGTGWSERSGEEYQHTKGGRREGTIRGWSDSKTGNIEI